MSSKPLPAQISVTGSNIRLVRLPNPSLLKQIFLLASKPEVSDCLGWLPHSSIKDTKKFFKTCAEENKSGIGCHFAIMEGDEVAGVTSLLNCNYIARKAEVTTWLGRSYWGRGINHVSKHLLFQFAFETLKLNKLSFQVAVNNDRSRQSHKSLHTTFEGTLRQELLVRGKLIDCLYFSLLADEYRQHYKALKLQFSETPQK
jgi:[ribosomal protein S5]-alanine N-acetyltransferase